MIRGVGQLSAKTRLVALLIMLGVGALPMSTVLDPIPDAPAKTRIQTAPPVLPNGAPAEDPLAGPAWAAHNGPPDLWPPCGDRPRPRPEARLQRGHLRRIDRPPTA
jgi:hypothetical protein